MTESLFGSGSLSLRFVFGGCDIVKIDRSFIDDILTDSRSFAVTGSIISLTDSLGMMVVSEGIENEAQRNLLMGLGCTYGQGYLFARPKAPVDFEEALRSWLATRDLPAIEPGWSIGS